MKRNRCVKIVATLGPSSSSPEMIDKLFVAGVDVFRINMSHTPHEDLKTLVEKIRNVEVKHGRPIGILVDLQGPKLRIGEMQNGRAFIADSAQFVLDKSTEPGTEKRVHLPHPEIFAAAKAGELLILDDGKLRLRVTQNNGDAITTTVEVGGPLASRKGVSLPDTLLPVSAMTDKDRRDLDFAAGLGIDWIALSFVQRADDVAEARKLLAGRAAIMTKVEKPAAVKDLDAIIEISEGLMVARGDLGVELPVEQVPGIQKQIIRKSRRAGRPVVVATQMLESMIASPVPTRAEVSDVATAVFEGADAVMLSAESAVGQYAVEAVSTMSRVATQVEGDDSYETIMRSVELNPEPTSADAIAAAARTVAETLKLDAIVCYTGTGSTGIRVARERPRQMIIALSPIEATGRRLAIVWGLHCVNAKDATDLDDMVEHACEIARREEIAREGSRILITAGVPLGTPGATNMLRVAYVGEKQS